VAVDVVQSMTKDVNLQWWLDYLYKQREAVLGVPKIFMSEPEGTNKSTAEVVMQEYVTRLRMMQEILSDILETDLFKQLIEHKFGVGVEVPEIKWKPIWDASLQDKAAYLVNLVENGIVTVTEARMQLGFPELPEGMQTPPGMPVPAKNKEKQLKPEDIANAVVEKIGKGN
jgi:hypothetical protein